MAPDSTPVRGTGTTRTDSPRTDPTTGPGAHPDTSSGATEIDLTDDRRAHASDAAPSWKVDALGDNRMATRRNISWGAVIAGVVTFLALTVLLSLITAALGLGMADFTTEGGSEGVGTATGIWSLVTLALALAGGGYVAGVLAGRAGLIHGFLTWATALVATVVLATVLIGNVLGLAGTVLGTATTTVTDAVAQNPEQVTQVDPDEAGAAADDAQQQAEEAAQDAAPQVDQAADATAEGTVWAFVGLLIGAVIASLAGMLGSRSVVRDDERELAGTRR